jgi:hypothetical protein
VRQEEVGKRGLNIVVYNLSKGSGFQMGRWNFCKNIQQNFKSLFPTYYKLVFFCLNLCQNAINEWFQFVILCISYIIMDHYDYNDENAKMGGEIR